MTKPGFSPLKRVLQRVGLEPVIPHLHEASETELQESFAVFLYCIEGHKDLGISEHFNPTTLPSVPFSKVKKAMEEVRSPLMDPFFSMNREDVDTLMSYDARSISLIEPPLDSDDILGCRVFFRVVTEAVEEGYRIVVLNNERHTLSVSMHIKELRMLKSSPDSIVRGDSTDTILLQVEYHFMSIEDSQNPEESLRMLADLITLHPKGKTRIVWGTEDHIRLVHEILQGHERLLEKTIISAHNEKWNFRQKYIRPSFIVPLKVIAHRRHHQDILQEILGGTVISTAADHTPSERVESENAHPCAVCGKTNMKLKVCPCKSIKYCSRECQVSDWKSHKQTCKAIRSDLKCGQNTNFGLLSETT